MALGDSIVSICNITMIALGEDLVTNVFPPDPSKRAILCAQRYDDVRRAVLRSHPWECAKKYAQPAAASTAPLFSFDNAFPLPADCLRPLPLVDADGNVIDDVYEQVGNAILTDASSPINLPYIYDLQDPTQFDPLLVQGIGYALAGELAKPLTQSRIDRDEMLKIFEEKLELARAVSSQINSTREWDVDVLLRSRR